MSDADRRILTETIAALTDIGAVSEPGPLANSLQVRFKGRELLLAVRNPADRWKRNRVLTDIEQAACRAWPGDVFLTDSARQAVVAILFGKRGGNENA